MMKKTEVFKLFGGTPRSVAKALDITVPTVYAWGDEVSRQTIDRIVTVLVKDNRKSEAGEIIKRYLK